MIRGSHPVVRAAIVATAAMVTVVASAHSTSDAYLTLDAQARKEANNNGAIVARGQWDISLRDLHFVLGLDDDGNGSITWAELRKHQPAIARYVYPNLRVSGDNGACVINPVRQAVTNHADGAYAALFFDIVCTRAPQRLTLDYRLLFAVDPSHRGILLLRSGSTTAISLLAPENSTVDLKL